MSRIVADSLPGTSARITFHQGYPAMTPTKGNYALLDELSDVSEDLGFGRVEALDPGDRGAGDIGFISDLVPSLDGIGGASGGNSHAPGRMDGSRTVAEVDPAIGGAALSSHAIDIGQSVTRVSVAFQFTSQVLPPSSENACSK